MNSFMVPEVPLCERFLERHRKRWVTKTRSDTACGASTEMSNNRC